MHKSSFTIVIGASAGGLDALDELMTQLPPDINAAVFIVLHLSHKGISEVLRNRLQRYATLPCVVAQNEEPVKAGYIYIAPPDYHLILKENVMHIVSGPVENRWRPSIDVLFRSAAVSYGERIIGVVLTGMLDDGTSGMLAIKKCGGTCIVQDPNEAEYPDMPMSVLNNMEVDYCIPLAEMGSAIRDVMAHKEIKGISVPPEIQAEAAIAEKTISAIDMVSRLGSNSVYTCPDCGGGLWEIKEDNVLTRYRCHIGHAYTEKDLLKKQGEKMESTLWVALRIMEERRNLLTRIGQEENRKGLGRLAETHFKRATDLELHIAELKTFLFATKED